MKKIISLGSLFVFMALFSGCTSSGEVEYVRVTQFQTLEKKIEILESDLERSEEKFLKLQEEVSGADTKESDNKIDVLEKAIQNIETDFLGIKEDFEENKKLSEQQIAEIDEVLQNLEKVKEHYLNSSLEAGILQDAEQSLNEEDVDLKPAPSPKVIDLEAEAQKIRDAQGIPEEVEEEEKEEKKEQEETQYITQDEDQNQDEKEGNISGDATFSLDKLRMVFVEEKQSDGKELFIFEYCAEEGCKKYIANKEIFAESATLPNKEDVPILLSGEATFLGEISGEEYFQVTGKVVFEPASELPDEGVSIFESGGDVLDKEAF